MTEENFDFYVSKINYAVNKFYNPKTNIRSGCYNPKTNMITKYYTEYTLSLCTEGEGYYLIDGMEYIVKKGDISFFPKYITRSYKNVPCTNWNYISVSFDMRYMNNDETVILNNIKTFNKNTPYEIRQLFIKFYDEWIGRSLGYKLRCRTTIQEILMDLIDLNSKKEYPQKYYQEIENARKFIQNHIKESIDFDKLIADSSLSPTHFRRLFKKIVGYSPRDYYNNIKIKQSYEMLKTGIFTVSEVANEMGYSSVYYYSATFKKYYNKSPNSYIKLKKNTE